MVILSPANVIVTTVILSVATVILSVATVILSAAKDLRCGYFAVLSMTRSFNMAASAPSI